MSKLRFAQAGVTEIHAGMYRDTLMLMTRRIELFVSLPLDKLDKLAIQKKIKEIWTK